MRTPARTALRSCLTAAGGGLACLVAVFRCGGAEPDLPGPTSPAPLDYFIVVTGSELLEGVYPDSHTHFLTRTLRPIGLHCLGSISVDDRPEDLRDALRVATAKARLVIVTGGLGPTTNDITRETLAAFTGIALREDPEVLAALERRFRQPRDQLRANLRRQTLVPSRGRYLPNPGGTAVGLVYDDDDRVIVALPGPPRELQPMVRDELMAFLRRRFNTRPPGCSLTLRFVGVGQSQISQTIHDHIALASDVVVTSQFDAGRVDFTFSLPGSDPDDQARLQRLAGEIRAHLGALIYSEDGASLEDQLVRRLRARQASMVIAEAGTGGRIAAALTLGKGSSHVLAGAYAAPDVASLQRLVGPPTPLAGPSSASEETARRMSRLARDRAGCPWGLTILAGDGEAGRAAGLVLALGMPDERWATTRIDLPVAGELPYDRLTTQVLDWLRRQLPGQEATASPNASGSSPLSGRQSPP